MRETWRGGAGLQDRGEGRQLEITAGRLPTPTSPPGGSGFILSERTPNRQAQTPSQAQPRPPGRAGRCGLRTHAECLWASSFVFLSDQI